MTGDWCGQSTGRQHIMTVEEVGRGCYKYRGAVIVNATDGGGGSRDELNSMIHTIV